MQQGFEDELSVILELRKNDHPFILTLREQFVTGHSNGTSTRTSDASDSALSTASPASLEADLAHYKELFSKLRWSYREQVTKEKLVRALVGDSPLTVDHDENVQLEASLLNAKASLKEQKADVADIIADIERKARDLSRRYEAVESTTAQAQSLAALNADLESSVASLRCTQDPDSDSHQSLSLSTTLSLVEERTAELNSLNRQLASLLSTAERKTGELDSLQAELRRLEVQRQMSTKAAEEAQRAKAGFGGSRDDLEERGRWWRAAGEVLKLMSEAEH